MFVCDMFIQIIKKKGKCYFSIELHFCTVIKHVKQMLLKKIADIIKHLQIYVLVVFFLQFKTLIGIYNIFYNAFNLPVNRNKKNYNVCITNFYSI